MNVRKWYLPRSNESKPTKQPVFGRLTMRQALLLRLSLPYSDFNESNNLTHYSRRRGYLKTSVFWIQWLLYLGGINMSIVDSACV